MEQYEVTRRYEEEDEIAEKIGKDLTHEGIDEKRVYDIGVENLPERLKANIETTSMDEESKGKILATITVVEKYAKDESLPDKDQIENEVKDYLENAKTEDRVESSRGRQKSRRKPLFIRVFGVFYF